MYNAGYPTVNGVPFGKIIVQKEIPGALLIMIWPAAMHTAGAKRVLRDFVMLIRFYAWLLLSGTGRILF